MAVVFFDSCGDSYSTLTEAGWIGNSTPDADGRTGRCIAFAHEGYSMYKDLGANYTTFVLGGAFKITGGSDNRYMIQIQDGATNQVEVRVDGQRLTLTRNTVVLADSGYDMPLGQWVYIELKVVFDNTNGSYDLRVNGVSKVSATGVDTQNSANAYGNRIRIAGTRYGTNYVDDIYVDDSTLRGDCAVRIIRPTGNGNSSQFVGSDANSTDNYLLVDESIHNSDTDYVQSSTAGEKDTYAYGAIPVGGTVFAVKPCSIVRKDDAGARTFRNVARLAGAEATGATEAPGTGYGMYGSMMLTKPGGGAWSVSDVNAAEFGIEVVA